MKKLRQCLYVLLCTAICISSAAPTVAALAAETALDPLSGIDNKIVWDFSEQKKMSTSISLDSNLSSVTPVTHNGVSALKLNYTQSYKYPLLTFSVTSAARAAFKDDTYYMAVTYMTDNTGTLLFKLGSHEEEGDSKGTIVKATQASDKWVTAVYGGDTPTALGKKWLDTVKTGQYTHPEKGLTSTRVHFAWTCSDPRSNIYFKEVVFFSNPEDAKIYAERANSYYNGTASTQNNPDTDNVVSPSPHTVVPDGAPPVVMSFSSKSTNTTQYVSRYSTSKGWEYSNVDGVECVKLTYAEAEGVKYSYKPKFTSSNQVTKEHKYVSLVFMTTEMGTHSIKLFNDNNGKSVILATDTYASNGKWTATSPVDISASGALMMFVAGFHNSIEFSAPHEGAEIYLKEIVFFTSKLQADAYDFNDITNTAVTDPLSGIDNKIVWDFSEQKKMSTSISLDSNLSSVTPVTHNGVSALKLNYTQSYKYPLLTFSVTSAARAAFKDDTYYMAVTYMTDNTGTLLFKLGSHEEEGDSKGTIVKATQASDKWVTAVYGGDTPTALGKKWLDTVKTGQYTHPEKGLTSTRVHFAWTCSDPRSNIYFKEVVFFSNPEDAKIYAERANLYYNNVGWSEEAVKIFIGENPIENYRIVIAKDSNSAVIGAAKKLQSRYKDITGTDIPIVTDETAVTDYEILLGKTNRPESDTFYGADEIYGAANAAKVRLADYRIKVIGKKLVFASPIGIGINSAVEYFNEIYFHGKLIGTVALSPEFYLVGTPVDYTANLPTNTWMPRVNTTDPKVLIEDFTTDNGYFTEEDAKNDWKYEKGALATKAKAELSLAYIHVYESNAEFEADFTYSSPSDDAVMGITLRCTAPEAYVRTGYDFNEGEWYIETRQGYDFDSYRVATSAATLVPGENYRLTALVDGNVTILAVNGTEMLRSEVTTQVTPGRVGVYAKGVDVSVDNVKLTLLSGEGTVLKNLNHTIVGRERGTFIEGASPLVMNDGSILLTRSKNFNYVSKDDGITWESVDTWTDYNTDHPNFLRLENGDWLKLEKKYVDGVGYMVCELSSDDGKNWRDGGVICAEKHDETGKYIANMNDMITQVRSGRIFVSMTYSQGVNTKIWYNFVTFYYSDDNGITWHKSLDSRHIEGNAVTVNEKGIVPVDDKAKYFAEARIIQCADGRIRMLNSWNNYPCFVYCDSFDNGETWGPLQMMDEFTCNRSSYAIARDKYAENDTTYYMVWCYDIPYSSPTPLPRSRFALAKTTDGMNWEYIGDVWRWESADCVGPNPTNGNSTHINHIVDPAITVTRGNLIIGSGISEYCTGNHASYHNVQLQHMWTISKDTLPESKVLNSFIDIDAGASYNNAVSYVVSKGLFNGMSTTSFEPHTIMNRAMFVTVLGRLDGVDAAQYTKVSFSDVEAGSWYAPYVEWASANGVVNGMGNGTYGVTESITVQQACLMLYRYANAKTAATSTSITVTDFADFASVAGWAKDGVEWALANGIYAGQGGKLEATSPASRALVATMFYNYVSAFKK